jgi:hypothetical protein
MADPASSVPLVLSKMLAVIGKTNRNGTKAVLGKFPLIAPRIRDCLERPRET